MILRRSAKKVLNHKPFVACGFFYRSHFACCMENIEYWLDLKNKNYVWQVSIALTPAKYEGIIQQINRV